MVDDSVRQLTVSRWRRRGRASGPRVLLGLLPLGLLTACAGIGRPPPISGIGHGKLPTEVPEFAGERPRLIAADDIYRLSASQREAFLSYYHDSANRGEQPIRRLYAYMKRTAGAFNYSEHTRTAEQVHRLGGGNCLSLANMTTALARIVGIGTGYQLMTDLPVFEKQGTIILRGEHVRSVIFDPASENTAGPRTFDFRVASGRSRMVIDYFSTGQGRFLRNVSEAEFSAMYFRNMAVEALARGDLSATYWFTMASLELAPDHVDALNTLAVIYRRSGDDETAEAIYDFGLEKDPNRPTLLKNYRVLLTSQGRLDEAREITDRLATLRDVDPFDWWFLAEDAYQEKNYSDALAYFRKSVKIAPYLHEGYFGMAKSHYQLGQIEPARRALRRAMENAGKERFRTLYEAKLAALSRQTQAEEEPVHYH